jgi:perosamine synthetase
MTKKHIPYGRQWIDEEDISEVCAVLRSDWITTGPKVSEFEEVFASQAGAKCAVAVSSGTAALHASMYALDIGPGDEVIVPPMTFAATVNCVVYQGGRPIFADVDPETLLLDPDIVSAKITSHTKAIIAVDYAGQPCDYDTLREIADGHGLFLVADACHSLGGSYKRRPVGTLAELNAFSLHPVKNITTGEGGVITTNNEKLAQRMRIFRNHGITTDLHQREKQGSWYYEMLDLGYNYRLTDFQCALGISQLRKLPDWIKRRQEIAGNYNEALAEINAVEPLGLLPDISHAYHLYVVRLLSERPLKTRRSIFKALREEGISVNVHYIPVHLHPFYRTRFGTGPGLCPIAEEAYEHLITLPIYPKMTSDDVEYVMSTLGRIIRHFS